MQTRRKRNERAQIILMKAKKQMKGEDFDGVLRIVSSAMALGLPKWKSVILLYSILGALSPDDTPEDAANRRAVIDYIRSGKMPMQHRKAEAEHGKA